MSASTPYAKLLVAVNGGAPTSGGIDVPSAATVQFSAESTVGWRQQRWEIYDYPEGWATPAGWSLAADGTVYSTDLAPAAITLPANTDLWGGWAPRLKINEAVDDDATTIANLVDETTALMMLSPRGLRDVFAGESTQFTTTVTRHKRWLRAYQRMLRSLEVLLGAAGSRADVYAGSRDPVGVTTTDATETTLDSFSVPSGVAVTVTWMVTAIAGAGFGVGSAGYSVSATFHNDGVLLNQRGTTTLTVLGESDAAWTVGIDVSGTTVRLRVTGKAATTIRWGASGMALEVVT